MVARGCVCVYVCVRGVLSGPRSVNNPINWLTKQPRGNNNINPGFRGHYVSAHRAGKSEARWGCSSGVARKVGRCHRAQPPCVQPATPPWPHTHTHTHTDKAPTCPPKLLGRCGLRTFICFSQAFTVHAHLHTVVFQSLLGMLHRLTFISESLTLTMTTTRLTQTLYLSLN